MEDPRRLEWNENVWKALLRSLAYIPPTTKVRALASIVEEAEKAANGGRVGEAEVLAAIESRVPEAFREQAKGIFREELV